MKAINNAYIVGDHAKPHIIHGNRKRDMLSFREELALHLIDNVRAGDEGRKMRSNMEEEESRLIVVGIHLPQKGAGKDYRCIVCRKKRTVWISANPDADVKDCPFPLSKTTFACSGCKPSVCVCIKKESNCYVEYHTKVQFTPEN